MIDVVTAEEMRRLDSAIDPAKAMAKAAEACAMAVGGFIYDHRLPPRILLLAGKGNNGGDAFATGALLLERGFFVQAYSPFPPSSFLCKSQHDHFIAKKGEMISSLPSSAESFSLIIDGLVGTGFQGETDGPLGQTITWANASKRPIFAIDIPSGLHASTGEAAAPCIQATATIYLGLPKIGFFINDGWNFVGKLIPADIGSLPQPQAAAHLLQPASLKLPPLKRTRHKYSAGYVLGIAGSPALSGAAALSSSAVLRSGAGIIRLLTLPKTSPHAFPAEIITEEYNLARFQEEVRRAAAIFVGPGLGRTTDVEKLLYQLLPSLNLPVVLDADALYFLAKNPSWTIPSHSILTPHHREMETLLQQPPTLTACQEYAEKHNTTLILKGAPTVIFYPQEKPLIVTTGDPGMATAGTGDVLTGLLAGLLAQKMPPREAAALGVYLHGRAGELAALELTSYGMMASDLLRWLPGTMKEVLLI
jgi:ADP-dependent NAD(P)H-hydrate dehydratase / NAD(P)H-hydrate epimerase